MNSSIAKPPEEGASYLAPDRATTDPGMQSVLCSIGMFPWQTVWREADVNGLSKLEKYFCHGIVIAYNLL